VLLATAVGGLAGAYLLKGIFSTFGSQLLSIFMISGFFRALVVMYLIPKLVDLGVSYGKPKAPPKVSLDLRGKIKVSKRGLFYQPMEPAGAPVKASIFRKDKAVVDSDIQNVRRRSWAVEKRVVNAPTAKKEMSVMPEVMPTARKRSWALAEKPIKEKEEAARPAMIKSSRHPWYGDPEILSAYSVKKAASSLPMAKSTGPPRGLYYDEDIWRSYLRETRQSVMKESRERRAAAGLRPVPVESNITSRMRHWERTPVRLETARAYETPDYLR
jgi:hypothetical protein